jgi:serine/threonine-protein kinase
VQINRDDYIGRNVDEVRAELEAAGLVVSTQQGAPATNPDQANTVSDVNPSGPLPIGSTITVTFLGAPETPAAPAGAPSVDPSEVQPGGIVQVSWPAATCPSGQQLSGYEVAVTGDAVTPSPVGAGTTSVNVQAGQESFEVTYRYFCGPLDSPFSPAAPVTVGN